MNLPNSSNASPLDLPKDLKLEIIIRPDDLVINDRNSGPLKSSPIRQAAMIWRICRSSCAGSNRSIRK